MANGKIQPLLAAAWVSCLLSEAKKVEISMTDSKETNMATHVSFLSLEMSSWNIRIFVTYNVRFKKEFEKINQLLQYIPVKERQSLSTVARVRVFSS